MVQKLSDSEDGVGIEIITRAIVTAATGAGTIAAKRKAITAIRTTVSTAARRWETAVIGMKGVTFGAMVRGSAV